MKDIDWDHMRQQLEAAQRVKQRLDQIVRRAARPAIVGIVLSTIGLTAALWSHIAPGLHWTAHLAAVPAGAVFGYGLVRVAMAVDTWLTTRRSA